MSIYIVMRDDSGPTLDGPWAFENEEQAETFAGVRGGCNVFEAELITEADAKRLIKDEAKERADEERFERMRQGDI